MKVESITWQAIMGELIVKWENKNHEKTSNKQQHVEEKMEKLRIPQKRKNVGDDREIRVCWYQIDSLYL
jgi:hypothetical protein